MRKIYTIRCICPSHKDVDIMHDVTGFKKGSVARLENSMGRVTGIDLCLCRFESCSKPWDCKSHHRTMAFIEYRSLKQLLITHIPKNLKHYVNCPAACGYRLSKILRFHLGEVEMPSIGKSDILKYCSAVNHRFRKPNFLKAIFFERSI